MQAYVLMDNHYHLLLETPEPNLSAVGQWLNVSYSVWFNRRHRRSGHLFQGRFKAVIVEDNAGWQRVGRYVHLNPVRVAQFGLDKRRRQAPARGLAEAADEAMVAERLRSLREFRWSSYPAYAGDVAAPPWLTLEPLGKLCGGRTKREQQAALRQFTEQAVTAGRLASPWEEVVGGVVLGSVAYARELLRKVTGNRREQPALARFRQRASWAEIVKAVEAVKGERWEAFRDRHGDWGRDAAVWLGRQVGRLRLRELAALAGDCDYTTMGKAVSRFARRLTTDTHLARQVKRVQTELSNFEM